jgi:molybdopterin converting factor small subunit
MKDVGDGTRRAPIVYGRNRSFGVPEKTMQIRVKLFATLSRYALNGVPGIPFLMELSEGATLGDVVRQLKLPREEVKVFFVNGRARPEDWILQPGDEVGIFPLVAGG